MNYSDILSAVYERRFPTSSPVASWVDAAYTDIWNSFDWSFRHVFQETWYTSTDGTSSGAATAKPKMPPAFERHEKLYDQNGRELSWLAPNEFAVALTPVYTGQPEAFTVVNRQIILGPTPTGVYPFLISYRRRLAHRDGSLNVQSGFMRLNDDQPLWDDHHYLIVLRAKLIGLRDRSDPTSYELESEYTALLSAMQESYAVDLPTGYQLPSWRP